MVMLLVREELILSNWHGLMFYLMFELLIEKLKEVAHDDDAAHAKALT